MTKDVVELKVAPVENKVYPLCVAALEAALEEARSGEMTGVFISKQFVAANAVSYHIVGSYNSCALIGSVSVGLHVLIAEAAADDVSTYSPEDTS